MAGKKVTIVKGDVKPGVYHLIICLDVEAYNLEQAYERVYDTMDTVDAEDFQWESTDEAFDPEGDEIDPDELQEARMKVFARKQEPTRWDVELGVATGQGDSCGMWDTEMFSVLASTEAEAVRLAGAQLEGTDHMGWFLFSVNPAEESE